MKVMIKNWGPIKECEYDLEKSMLVTYGGNSVGKSYAMQIMYLLLKNLIAMGKAIIYYRGYPWFRDERWKEIRELLMDFVDSEGKTKDITEQINHYLVSMLEDDLMNRLQNSYMNTFGNYDQILLKEPCVSFSVGEITCCKLYMQQQKMELKMNFQPIRLSKSNSNFHKSHNGKNFFDIYVFENHIETPTELVRERLEELQKAFYMEIVTRFHDVYFLPASRSGIYTGMSSFGPILTQLSQNRAFIKGEIQIPGISEPVSDYYMELSNIKLRENADIKPVVEEIEKEILKGTVVFDPKKKTILYQREGSFEELEMADVSSMVSEISPITAFIKYIVNNRFSMRLSRGTNKESVKKSAVILFIEEPEAHLHPTNQVKLMKCFAKLLEHNVKLIMASHSNYVFNELNNLVIGKMLSQEEYEPVLMYMTESGSVTERLDLDELGAADRNFTDITQELYQERETLIAKRFQM